MGALSSREAITASARNDVYPEQTFTPSDGHNFGPPNAGIGIERTVHGDKPVL